MYGFIEPMEATAVGMYHRLCKCAWDGIFDKVSFEKCNQNIKSEMIETQNIVLWHYQYGSKFIGFSGNTQNHSHLIQTKDLMMS